MKKLKIILITIILIFAVILIAEISSKYFVKPKNENNQLSQITERYEVKLNEKEYSMHNGGYFAKIDNIAIFLDPLEYELYEFDLDNKTGKKLNLPEDKAGKIYFDGDNIYCMPYHNRGKGIYKIDLDGNITKIYDGESIQLWLTEDKIYFVDQIGYDEINATPQGNLCIMDKDGKNKEVLIKNVKNYFKINQDYIYYTDQNDRDLYRVKNGEEPEKLAEGRTYITQVTDECVEYIDFEDGEKHRVLYLNNMQNDEIGRFGNCIKYEDNIYVFTRKLIGDDNDIEDEYTLFKIDPSNNEKEEIIKNSSPIEYLYHIYNGYAYFEGTDNGYRVKVDENSENKEEISKKYSYFINNYAYGFNYEQSTLKSMSILNLDNMQEEVIDIK